MKNTSLDPLIFALSFSAPDEPLKSKNSSDRIAVLELFTSEGCSSCPPADELMGLIQEQYIDDNVFVLSYHVDYWDDLGWKDIYSKAEYTTRQYQYASLFGSRSVYTPQVVINGQDEYIGSRETVVREGIKKALSKTATTKIELKPEITDTTLKIQYSVTGAGKDSSLILVLVEKKSQSSVLHGENAGHTLKNYQIVRETNTIELKAQHAGIASIELPADFNSVNFELIGFMQDMKSGAITGATRAGF